MVRTNAAGYDGMSSDSGGEPTQQPCKTWRTKRAGVAAASAALLLTGGAALAVHKFGRGQASARADAAMGAFLNGPKGPELNPIPLDWVYPIPDTLPYKSCVRNLFDTGRLGYDLGSDNGMLSVSSFVPYYSYTGKLKVSGKGSVVSSGVGAGAAQTLSFSLEGVDPACKGNPPDKANACGIHIHAGMSCTDNAEGHYWNKDLLDYDPWASVTYTSCKAGSVELSGVKVITGLSAASVDGHTMIIHDSTGARVACGIITPLSLSVPDLTKYPGYTGDAKITGSLLILGKGSSPEEDEQTLFWYLKGQPTECLSGPKKDTPNSCGVHIHEGFTCEDAGGHYYNKAVLNEDPWKTVGYGGPWGYATGPWGFAKVEDGYDMYDIMGRTLVVHDYSGARAACGYIQPVDTSVPALMRYGGYTGTLQVTGYVAISAGGKGGLDAAQVMSYRLSGVDPACTEEVKKGAPANACGIHIHAKANCSDAGGHYYAPDLKGGDPWKTVTYQAASGVAMGKDVEVVTGLSMYDILGKAFVVHDSTGARVGCGYIGIRNGK